MVGSELGQVKENFSHPEPRIRALALKTAKNLSLVLSPVPDKPFLIFKYLVLMRRLPDLDAPRRFSEKVQIRKLKDRNPLFPALSDKAAVKEHIGRIVGTDHVVPSYWVGTDIGEIDWETLPLPAIVKPTHASGLGALLYDRGDVRQFLRNNPVPRWLGLDFSRYNREWAYRMVSPRIIVERMLLDNGRLPSDYRVYVFRDVISHIEVNVRSGPSAGSCFYRPDWQPLELEDLRYQPHVGGVPRPERLEDMLALARQLCAGLDFLRVDFYLPGRELFVGELTLYPGGGFDKYRPDSFDVELGSMWRLPDFDELRP